MRNNLRGAVCLASKGKIRAVLGKMRVSDRPRNQLLNVYLLPLGCTSHLRLILVAQKLINNIIVVMGR